LPWGMNLWTPQTNVNGHGWTYQYDAEKIKGFKQTHQPSPWMNDYGQFSIMPVCGGVKFDQESRASWFSHKAEVSKPYYYSVYLADADVTAELVPTYPQSDSSFVVIDAFNKGSYVKIIPAERKVIGYSTKYARGKLINFKNYFVLYFDKDFTITHTWHEKTLAGDTLELNADNAGAIIGFKTKKGEQVNVRVASSFISFEQAELNLKREIANDDFEALKQKAKDVWNKTLNRIQVDGGTHEQKQTFYSCLYRAVFFPNKLYEINSQNEIVHWSPYNGQVLPGRMFGGTGFWDTFRALYPFLNLVYPSINAEMQEGLVNDTRKAVGCPNGAVLDMPIL